MEQKYVTVRTTIALTERKMVMLLRKAVMEEAGPRTLEKKLCISTKFGLMAFA